MNHATAFQLKRPSISQIEPYRHAEPPTIRARGPQWLDSALQRLWEDYFWDVPQVAPVRIRFGPRWKTRLGLIRWEAEAESSLIVLNGYFRDLRIPTFVCDITIAHELAHYAHGFGSPLPRRHDDPHANDLIERELTARGLGSDLASTDAWLEENWEAFRAATAVRST